MAASPRTVRELHAARSLLDEGRQSEALTRLEALAERRPQDRAVLETLYDTARSQPESEVFHRAAMRILNLSGDDPEAPPLMARTLRDYARVARPRARVTPSSLARLAVRLARADYLDEARRLVGMLLRRAPGHARLPGALLKLSEALHRAGLEDESQRYMNILLARYPNSDASHLVTSQRRLEMSW